MPRFEDLDQYLDATLTLPIHGVEYKIPPVSAEIGLRAQRIMEISAQAKVDIDAGREPEFDGLDDAAELDIYRDLLGPAFDEMIANGVDWPAIKHAAVTTWLYVTNDAEEASIFWRSGGDPEKAEKLRAPNRAARRQRTAAASSTRSRGSTSTTSSRKAPVRRRKAG